MFNTIPRKYKLGFSNGEEIIVTAFDANDAFTQALFQINIEEGEKVKVVLFEAYMISSEEFTNNINNLIGNLFKELKTNDNKDN